MAFKYDVKKAVQLTAYMISVSGAKSINRMALMKLLYILDRKSLKEFAYPITGDAHYALKHGPVLTKTLDLSKGNLGNTAEQIYWNTWFDHAGYEITLKGDPGVDQLSQYEMESVAEVFSDFGHLSQFKLRDVTHSFPEWIKNNPGGSSRPISLEDIVEAVGTGDRMEDFQREKREAQYFESIFGG